MTDLDLDPQADGIAGLDDCDLGWGEPRPIEELPDISIWGDDSDR